MHTVEERTRRAMTMGITVAAPDFLLTPPSAGGRFVREGLDRAAGYACTVWRAEDRAGNVTASACVTEAGVPLRLVPLAAAGQDQVGAGLEAVAVSMAPQDPARFRVPDGYEVLDLVD